jgi:glyoxylase-like metal-dependent hydrolase (beta-lactamase superfamily II)
MMKIGKYEIVSVETGRFYLDGGAMFGIIPKPLWERSNPPDEKNRIEMAARVLLLRSDSKAILLDTGMGVKWDEKQKGIYNYRFEEHLLLQSLKQLSISPEDITDVIFTHLHFDHAGGATISEGGNLTPAFPNAVYHVRKKNYEWGMNASERDRGSYIKENFEPLMKEGVLKLIEGGNYQFDDEIYLPEFNGHTFGQQLPLIADGETALFFCGDLFPTSSHLALPYIMGYDLQPLQTLAEKKEILKRAVEENWTLVYEHDPFYACSKAVFSGKGYVCDELRGEL